jgi:hypothetical protein
MAIGRSLSKCTLATLASPSFFVQENTIADDRGFENNAMLWSKLRLHVETYEVSD